MPLSLARRASTGAVNAPSATVLRFDMSSAAELLSDRKTIAEGAFTAPVLARLARDKGIDMPIVDAVDALIAGRANVDEVLGALLSRPPKSEAI